MAEENKFGDVLYSWKAKEFSSNRRSAGWYVVAGIIFLAAVVYTIYIHQWIGLGVVVMIGVLIYLSQSMAPRVFDHKITDRGIAVGKKFYEYSNLRSFWIVLDKDNPTLNLMLNKKLSLLLTLQLGTADVERIRKILGDFLPEDANRGEDIADKITKFLKL
ncbi:hypothetical protein DRH29_02545 [candidate division Kazan bacterium]|uniref:DUF5673 domain-containing protein n=1 Tax=candidate division Kazan bacterium TaxID=2202143 RepID=A0A420ZCS8_UNCK3|nr:MAG: hypothetical protein DRH29_02545 [candidate division Kazan bacterium]